MRANFAAPAKLPDKPLSLFPREENVPVTDLPRLDITPPPFVFFAPSKSSPEGVGGGAKAAFASPPILASILNKAPVFVLI